MAVLRYTLDGVTWVPFTVGNQGPPGEDGEQGIPGPPGAGVAIKGSVPTWNDLPQTAAIGDAWLTQDNGHVNTWDGLIWINGGKITGPKGDPGEITFAVGDVRYVLAQSGTLITPTAKGSLKLRPPSGSHGLDAAVTSTAEPVKLTPLISGGAPSLNTLAFDANNGRWVFAESVAVGSVFTADSVTVTKKVSSAATQMGDGDEILTTKGYVDNTLPTGSIVAYAGTATAIASNPDWAVCDGRTHGSQALFDAMGTGQWFTPDLRSRFIVGAQSTGTVPDGLTARDRLSKNGNTEKVTLTADQSGLRAHNHGDTHNSSASHSHQINRNHWYHNHGMGADGAHTHNVEVYQAYRAGSSGTWLYDLVATGGGSPYGRTNSAGSHTHGIHHAFTTGNDMVNTESGTATHAHTTKDVTAANATQSHENMPPWYALIYIVRL